MSAFFNYNLEKYTKLRKDLHQIPEFAYKEFKTKSFLLGFIKEFKNFELCKITEVLDTGFWIDVEGLSPSTSEKICISLRTDLDALPMQDKTDVSYRSIHEGYSHSCGHDGHMTILVCTLEQILLQIEKIPNHLKIRFLFQPAEEGQNGAKAMIKEGCLNGVNEIFGIHNITLYDIGTIGLKEGAVMAGADFFEIDIKGQGGHGSAPHLCCSPINAGVDIVKNLNQYISQRTNSANRSALSIGSFNSGEASNVIPNNAILKGTLRRFSPEIGSKYIEEIRKKVEAIAEVNDCKAELKITLCSDVTNNDSELVKEMKQTLENSNFKIVDTGLPVAASEDFADYQGLIKGVFFMLGCRDDNHQEYLHTPTYNYNDLATPYGVELYLRIVERRSGLPLFSNR